MEKNTGDTDRVFGETDGGHNAHPIDFNSGKQDRVNGAPI